MLRIPPEVNDYIIHTLQTNPALRGNYTALREDIAQRFGVNVSKPAISRRAGRLNITVPRGCKQIFPVRKRKTHIVYISYAGAFFLKGAELETGILTAINHLLVTKTKSLLAERALRLARAINAYLLYLPLVAGGNPSTQRGPLLRVPPHGRTTEAPRVLPVGLHLRTDRDVRGMLCLTRQKRLPGRREIKQYLDFLDEQNLWPLMVNEIEKSCRQALWIRVQTAQGTFYLDAPGRTVWPTAQSQQCFSTTLNRAIAYVETVFLRPFARRALVLQSVPGDAVLPPEVVTLIQCFEQKEAASACCLTILDELGNRLVPDIRVNLTTQKYFIFPLNTQQAAQFCKMCNIQGYQEVKIGPEKEELSIAGARAKLFTNSQHTEFIEVRAVIVEKEGERLLLVTNIPPSVERYAGRIAEQYFYRWPLTSAKSPLLGQNDKETVTRDEGVKQFLLRHCEERPKGATKQSQQDRLLRAFGPRNDEEEAGYLLPLQEAKQATLEGQADYPRGYYFFQLLLKCLQRYAQAHFFPAGSGDYLEQICCQGGYIRVTGREQRVYLYSFQDKQLQQIAQTACRNFNQSVIELPTQTVLRLFMETRT